MVVEPILNKINKLPVEERASLFLAMKTDEEMRTFLYALDSENILKEELVRRDAAFAAGSLKLTTIDQLTNRMKAKRNGL